jgi:transmembrane 9 superfamily protein 2/4
MGFPLFVFSILFMINFTNWVEQSEAAIPFPTILVIVTIYLLLSIPNVWLGSFIGFKKGTMKNPGKINKLSRDIPAQPWYFRMRSFVPLGGLFPFG